MTLTASIGVRRGSLELEVDLSLRDGETVALLGPNGAGKSTVLRVLAGLLAIDRGVIRVGPTAGTRDAADHLVGTADDITDGAEVWDDPVAKVFVEPPDRSVGVVFQDYALFAHLTVVENVAFGLRARGVHRRTARVQAGELVRRFGLADYADARPASLSGGQAQRVALARALATNPRLLLLDEPLAALDVRTRSDVRRDLRGLLAGYPGMRLLVTHDPVDAYALADRVVVLEEGRVAQSGTLAEVTMHPRSRYVADLVGLNLLRGEMDGGVLVLDSGAMVVAADSDVAGSTLVTFRPQAVSLHRQQPEGSQRNAWRLVVIDVDRRLDRCRVRLDGGVPLVAEVTPAALDSLGIESGDEVWAAVKATEVTAYPA